MWKDRSQAIPEEGRSVEHRRGTVIPRAPPNGSEIWTAP